MAKVTVEDIPVPEALKYTLHLEVTQTEMETLLHMAGRQVSIADALYGSKPVLSENPVRRRAVADILLAIHGMERVK